MSVRPTVPFVEMLRDRLNEIVDTLSLGSELIEEGRAICELLDLYGVLPSTNKRLTSYFDEYDQAPGVDHFDSFERVIELVMPMRALVADESEAAPAPALTEVSSASNEGKSLESSSKEKLTEPDSSKVSTAETLPSLVIPAEVTPPEVGDFKCQRCGDTIPQPRALSAMKHGRQPKYCSQGCGIAAQSAPANRSEGAPVAAASPVSLTNGKVGNVEVCWCHRALTDGICPKGHAQRVPA